MPFGSGECVRGHMCGFACQCDENEHMCGYRFAYNSKTRNCLDCGDESMANLYENKQK